jgi:hypothetical protein
MAAVTPIKLNAPDFQQFQSGDFLPYNFGGTGQTSVTSGSLLYGSATNVWSQLGIGTTGQILTVVSGEPAWSTPSSGSNYLLVQWTNGNGSTITQGQAVYLDGTNDTVSLAEANSITTSRVVGFVYDTSIASTATGNIIIAGIAPGVVSAATAGTVYYLSPTTAGAVTTTAPSTSGQNVCPLGQASDATNFYIHVTDITRL